MTYLLDTRVWVWIRLSPEKISKGARATLPGDVYEELLLSAISPWELSKLLANRRVELSWPPEEWIEAALQIPKLRLVPLSPVIAYRSTTLPSPFHDDPADQIIVATAREENATILTADEHIRSYRHVKSFW